MVSVPAGAGVGSQREGLPLETEANLPLADPGPAAKPAGHLVGVTQDLHFLTRKKGASASTPGPAWACWPVRPYVELPAHTCRHLGAAPPAIWAALLGAQHRHCRHWLPASRGRAHPSSPSLLGRSLGEPETPPVAFPSLLCYQGAEDLLRPPCTEHRSRSCGDCEACVRKGTEAKAQYRLGAGWATHLKTWSQGYTAGLMASGSFSLFSSKMA